MGYWGVRSYEHDDAHDALDAGFEAAWGAEYERLMDDRNPLTFEQVQQRLANRQTLEAALAWLTGQFGDDFETWDDEARLAYVGVVVRHVELGVPVAGPMLERACAWLDAETLDWERDQTRRDLRRRHERRLLNDAQTASGPPAASQTSPIKQPQPSDPNRP
ncbi:MAG: hypothetical protein KatS3mg108_3726 [Isosphaeraceae bacterium]|jgi:hypothetical protein|nr:MAG: hypothetical protein KatS3mg108_3726 [Isosphaeraceae bacterium]